ncbi:hypothetical protein [Aeromonas veronii]|uniref:hypothetical protein n=1 Tax=Aeromonas veronii TaxID=654 RepID=UPI003BA018C3
MKITNALFVAVTVVTAMWLGYTQAQQQKQIAVLEQYVQTQQEIICLNANSLPNQFYEHKDSCFGVAASVIQRHK